MCTVCTGCSKRTTRLEASRIFFCCSVKIKLLSVCVDVSSEASCRVMSELKEHVCAHNEGRKFKYFNENLRNKYFFSLLPMRLSFLNFLSSNFLLTYVHLICVDLSLFLAFRVPFLKFKRKLRPSYSYGKIYFLGCCNM